jgi:hypothetical protein
MTPKPPARPPAGEVTPFHRGELEVQTHAGVREDAARLAPTFRDHMPEPHRREGPPLAPRVRRWVRFRVDCVVHPWRALPARWDSPDAG